VDIKYLDEVEDAIQNSWKNVVDYANYYMLDEATHHIVSHLEVMSGVMISLTRKLKEEQNEP
jgi:hypothetical protein